MIMDDGSCMAMDGQGGSMHGSWMVYGSIHACVMDGFMHGHMDGFMHGQR